MKSALLKNSINRPDSWQDLPLGEEVKGLLENSLAEISRKFFGYHLVRLGNLSSEIQLPQCPIKHQINITRQQDLHTGVVGLPSELPIAENSVDTFLLAHELDFTRDPHQILREIDRTIMPNGYLVITGFNPFSLCGVFKYLPVNKQNALHQARFFSSTRVKDWLSLLGFELIETQHLLFNELFLQRRLSESTKWNMWCKKRIPWFSTLYVIVARKREIPLSLIKPKWKSKRNFSTVGASARTNALRAKN